MRLNNAEEAIIIANTPEELAGRPSLTDWNRIDTLSDDNIAAATLSDPDAAPLLTDDAMRKARPACDVLFEILPAEVASAMLKRPGRPKLTHPKEQVTLRLSPEVLSHFKKTGKGWQTRIDEALLDVIARQNSNGNASRL